MKKELNTDLIKMVVDGELKPITKGLPKDHREYLFDLIDDLDNIHQHNQYVLRADRLTKMGYDVLLFNDLYINWHHKRLKDSLDKDDQRLYERDFIKDADDVRLYDRINKKD